MIATLLQLLRARCNPRQFVPLSRRIRNKGLSKLKSAIYPPLLQVWELLPPNNKTENLNLRGNAASEEESEAEE